VQRGGENQSFNSGKSEQTPLKVGRNDLLSDSGAKERPIRGKSTSTEGDESP